MVFVWTGLQEVKCTALWAILRIGYIESSLDKNLLLSLVCLSPPRVSHYRPLYVVSVQVCVTVTVMANMALLFVLLLCLASTVDYGGGNRCHNIIIKCWRLWLTLGNQSPVSSIEHVTLNYQLSIIEFNDFQTMALSSIIPKCMEILDQL